MNNRRALGAAVAASALFALSAVPLSPANAAFITGEISLSGFNNLDLPGGTITFTGANTTNTVAETGDFLGLGTGAGVAFRNTGSSIDFNSPTAFTTGSNLTCASGNAGCMWMASNGVTTASFSLTTQTVIPDLVDQTLTILGTGVAALSGFQNTPGTFSLTAQTTQDLNTNLTFSATTAAVPGPIVGAGLPGLVAACGGLLALARRRHRRHIA
jgi:hypothetical protein